MYGTVMVGKLAASAGELQEELAAWERERAVAGFVGAEIMLCDDGRTVVEAVRFESKEAYLALAEDPEQDRWYRAHVAPLLDGDPQWFDGEWVAALARVPGQRTRRPRKTTRAGSASTAGSRRGSRS